MDSISFPVALEKWVECLGQYQADMREAHRVYMREWVAKNPEKKKRNDAASYTKHRKCRIESMNRWAEENPERTAAIKRRYHAAHRDEVLARTKKWQQENKPRRAATLRKWYARQRIGNPQFVLRMALSSRIWHALNARASKSAHTEELLGCRIPDLRAALQTQFLPGMSWDNYGQWHIDHIRPCASFDLTDPAQQRECFNFKNLQPLWAKDNLSKGAKYNAS